MILDIRYYTMLIHKKDDIEFVTEFSCLLGHPVSCMLTKSISHTEITEHNQLTNNRERMCEHFFKN